MVTVNPAQPKARLSQLPGKVEAGPDIPIARSGKHAGHAASGNDELAPWNLAPVSLDGRCRAGAGDCRSVLRVGQHLQAAPNATPT